METTIPRFYCINLARSTARRQRMEKRFALHGLDATFVTGIRSDCHMIDFFDHQMVNPVGNIDLWRKNIGCYLSHLKAIRTFLETTDESAIICEDDILFHNNFREMYHQVMANIPPETPLISFCYMNEQWECPWAGIDSSKKNVVMINPLYTWGAQCYYITKDHAKQILLTWDRCMCELGNGNVTPENYIRVSRGLMSYPPLVIEEDIDSERSPRDLPYHVRHFRFWGYHNYNTSDPERISPLIEQTSLNTTQE